MDDLVIFKDRALTESEIKTFMQLGTFAVSPKSKIATHWGLLKIGR